jgi:hypothetical protein
MKLSAQDATHRHNQSRGINKMRQVESQNDTKRGAGRKAVGCTYYVRLCAGRRGANLTRVYFSRRSASWNRYTVYCGGRVTGQQVLRTIRRQDASQAPSASKGVT